MRKRTEVTGKESTYEGSWGNDMRRQARKIREK